MLRYLGTGRRSYGSQPVRTGARVDWEFEAVLGGRIAPVLPAGPLPLAERTLWVFAPSAPHGWTGQGAAEVAVFHFSSVPEPLGSLGRQRGHLACALDDAALQTVRQACAAIEDGMRHPSGLDVLVHERILIDLALLLLRAQPARLLPSTAPDVRRVEQATTWFREHLHEAPNVQQVAAAVYCSPAHLRRLFHAVHQRSPQAVLNDIRFEQARSLMAEHRYDLDHIASLCGYGSASAFSRAFLQHTGVRPRTWSRRRRLRRDHR